MMNLIRKIFGRKQSAEQKPPVEQDIEIDAEPRTEQQIQEDANRLWTLLRETVEYYNTISCQCAFPRYIQYTSIDCRETHNSFYMSETEGFIQTSGDFYEVEEIDKGDENYKAIYTCKKCGSTYINAWSDFSISVNRTYLKPLKILAVQVGADPETPIPFFVGLFGHSYPDRAGFKHVDYDTFKEYIRALKGA